MNKRYEELYNRAVEMLDDYDDLFVDMVNELDSYNGFADGYRCYDMGELDDLFCGCSIGDFLDKITEDFNHRDNYIVDTIYGLESTDYVEDVYRDNTNSEEVLDALLDEIGGCFNPYFSDSEFEEIIKELLSLDPDDEDDADDLDDDIEEV